MILEEEDISEREGGELVGVERRETIIKIHYYEKNISIKGK